MISQVMFAKRLFKLLKRLFLFINVTLQQNLNVGIKYIDSIILPSHPSGHSPPETRIHRVIIRGATVKRELAPPEQFPL